MSVHVCLVACCTRKLLYVIHIQHTLCGHTNVYYVVFMSPLIQNAASMLQAVRSAHSLFDRYVGRSRIHAGFRNEMPIDPIMYRYREKLCTSAGANEMRQRGCIYFRSLGQVIK